MTEAQIRESVGLITRYYSPHAGYMEMIEIQKRLAEIGVVLDRPLLFYSGREPA